MSGNVKNEPKWVSSKKSLGGIENLKPQDDSSQGSDAPKEQSNQSSSQSSNPQTNSGKKPSE